MNISTLATYGVAGTIALLSVSQIDAQGVASSASSASASAVSVKPRPKVVVRRLRDDTPRVATPRADTQRVDVPAPSVIGSGPGVIGSSAAASVGGPGFAVIGNPAGAAASAAPPQSDAGAGAPTDAKMR